MHYKNTTFNIVNKTNIPTEDGINNNYFIGLHDWTIYK